MIVPETLFKAPPLLIPLPFKVKGSALIVVVICKAAPLATVVPELTSPRAAALDAVKAPAETVVRPVYVLTPDKINVPVPALVIVLAAPEIIPEYPAPPEPPLVTDSAPPYKDKLPVPNKFPP